MPHLRYSLAIRYIPNIKLFINYNNFNYDAHVIFREKFIKGITSISIWSSYNIAATVDIKKTGISPRGDTQTGDTFRQMMNPMMYTLGVIGTGLVVMSQFYSLRKIRNTTSEHAKNPNINAEAIYNKSYNFITTSGN